mgnify:CR=1 FL=1
MTTAHTEAVNAGPRLEFCPLMSNYGAPTITLVEGHGTEVFDVDGNRYLDFLCGLAVTSLGHSHPAVAAAIAEQARTLVHVSNLYNTLPGPEVALAIDQLVQTFPDGAVASAVVGDGASASGRDGAVASAVGGDGAVASAAGPTKQ